MKTGTLTDLLYEYDLFEREITLKRNEYLKTAGSIDTNVYLVTEGSLKVFIEYGSEEHIIRFGYIHNIIASLDSFLSGKPSEFCIQAIKKTTVKIISKKVFSNFLSKDAEHLKLWITLLEQLVLQQIEREKDLLISSPRERYQRVLKRSPLLFQYIPNKHIANYLRMKPETLSRLKKS